MKKKLKHSFATFVDEKTGDNIIHVDLVAKELAKGWGDIPKSINDLRAAEIYYLAKSYLKLKKQIEPLLALPLWK